jgi:chaperonin GroES
MANTKTKSKSTKTDVTPLGDRVLVRRTAAEETTKGGIILPDSAKEKPAEGTIIAVGAGRLDEHGSRLPLTVKVKDRVLFSSYAGSEIKLDGETYLILSEDEILAVIE